MDKPSHGRRAAPTAGAPTSAASTCTTPRASANHFFYLLAEGSGAKTVNGVATTARPATAPPVTGIGRDEAEQIWYRALTTKITSSTDYAAARKGAIASAKELYGAGSAQCLAVQNGFNAIAVPKGAQTSANRGRAASGGYRDGVPRPAARRPVAGPGGQRQTVCWSGGSCTSSSSCRAVVDSGSLPWASPRSAVPAARSTVTASGRCPRRAAMGAGAVARVVAVAAGTRQSTRPGGWCR